jgi:phosphoserine phosphatase RsbU/P
MDQEPQHCAGPDLERLELAMRASNEGVWDWRPGNREIYYSRRALEFLECGADHAPNLFLPPHEAVAAEDRRGFELVVTQALAPGGPETLAVDARVVTGGGGRRWLRIRGTVLRDRTGRALRVAGSMIDISRRKLAEAQVEEDRFLLRQLIDNVPLQIYFKDIQSRFVLANRRMAEWVGLADPAELNGRHDRDFFDDEHWQDAERDERRILETGEPVTGLLERETRQDGGETWVTTSKFPWRDRHGRVKGTFGVSSDVTELVRAQQAATALAEELKLRNTAYEEELQLAREIQQALAGGGFPEIAAADGRRLAFGARYIPISGMAGDFFEVLPVGREAAGLLICDVMGHGVRSALIVAMLRGLLEKQRPLAAAPGTFLQGLNEGLAAILERAGTTMFATAFYAYIDLAAGSLRYASAGHPGAVVSGPGGTRQLAAARHEVGPGLGLFPGAGYPVGELPLAEIDRMILFTDGLLEAENRRGEPFFEKRLMEIVASQAETPLDTLLDGILAGVREFSEGRHFDDDVCLLGVRLRGAG